MYMEISIAKANLDQLAQREDLIATQTVLGTEIIEGYECNKTEITYKNKLVGKVAQWISTKLGYALRTESKQGFKTSVTELKNIKEGRQPDPLFELPSDYTKFTLTNLLPFGKK